MPDIVIMWAIVWVVFSPAIAGTFFKTNWTRNAVLGGIAIFLIPGPSIPIGIAWLFALYRAYKLEGWKPGNASGFVIISWLFFPLLLVHLVYGYYWLYKYLKDKNLVDPAKELSEQ